MKILMLVNWKVKFCSSKPSDKQPPDYYVYNEDYWFYRYFKDKPEVDVVDISSFGMLEKFEKNTIRFYVWQALKVIHKLNRYDLIVSHGMQSGVVIALWRMFFKSRAKHVVFDIGSFASATESGMALKFMQYASKSIDGLIYHTSSQLNYYNKFFPWIVDKSKFIRFGTDLEFFCPEELKKSEDKNRYIICVGYAKRDWETLVNAYEKSGISLQLKLIGNANEEYEGIKGIEQIPFIPVRQLINQIYNASFCVLPLEDYNYSFGQMTLMQQMALGKCVIAADVRSLRDYVMDGKTAILYKPNDVEQLSKILIEIENKKAKLKTIGQNAMKYLQEGINEKIMAANVEKFLYDVYEHRK